MSFGLKDGTTFDPFIQTVYKVATKYTYNSVEGLSVYETYTLNLGKNLIHFKLYFGNIRLINLEGAYTDDNSIT